MIEVIEEVIEEAIEVIEEEEKETTEEEEEVARTAMRKSPSKSKLQSLNKLLLSSRPPSPSQPKNELHS